MDRPFKKPLILGNGRHTLTVASLIGASDFLLNEWPENRRGRKSYRLAVQAIVKARAGRVEPEVARQALLAAGACHADISASQAGPELTSTRRDLARRFGGSALER
ncbi:MAG: DUF982 domain-containing protein, partial [Microvirga sp.]